MQIQLYVEGQRLDMFENEGVSVTDTLKNVKDISKIFTEYSQTFKVPATKINNKVFKHYYNTDVQNGYDARVRAQSEIELSRLSFKKGYLKLEGVDLRNNLPYAYNLTFFGNTISLKELLGEDLLSDLSWLNNLGVKDDGTPLAFSPEDTKAYLTSSKNRTIDGVQYNNPIQTPLMTYEQRLFYDDSSQQYSSEDNGNLDFKENVHEGVKWTELKPAIKMSLIIKAIEEKYTTANGYSQNLKFSTDFFTDFSDLPSRNTDWDDLYMWLHRTQGQMESPSVPNIGDVLVEGWSPEQSRVGVYITNESTVYLDTNDASFDLLELKNDVDSGFSSVTYSYKIYANGLEVNSYTNVSGNHVATLNSSSYVNKSITVVYTFSSAVQFNHVSFHMQGTIVDDNSSYNYDVYANPSTANIGFQINPTMQMPKMKVLDFLTSVFKMFNLVAYIDDGIIVVKTLDSFYSDALLQSNNGAYDITRYIDVTNSKSNSALPFREIVFTYQGLKTYLADVHNQMFNKKWGEEDYNGGGSTIFSGGIFKYEIGFEHMKFERIFTKDTLVQTDIQWGFHVDDNRSQYVGKPTVFYMNLKTLPSETPISFINQVDVDGTPSSNESIGSYYAPCNSNMNTATFLEQTSLNFYPEFDEWEGTLKNNNTLFNRYHTQYISSVFSKSNRITKVSAVLPLRILINYTLADRFQISGKSYKINSIETNLKTGRSDIELLNDIVFAVDDGSIPLAPSNLRDISKTDETITLTWDAPESSPAGYNIEINQGSQIVDAGSSTTFQLTGLIGGTTYKIAIRSYNSFGTQSEDISNIINVTTDQ